MNIIYKKQELIDQISRFKSTYPSKKIGFVPTMGALHEGHLSLLKECQKNNELSIVSIFVNPTQFNDQNDFDLYPNTIEQDIELLNKNSCDILFAPNVLEMYPNGNLNIDSWDFGPMGTVLDGAMRPGHFDGVAHIVSRLIAIVCPDRMYMGMKDFQQMLIVREMARQIQSSVEIIGCPTYRDRDGLAMSSRNNRLNSDDRHIALNLSKALFYIRDHKFQTPPLTLIEKAIDRFLSGPKIKLEYLELRNAQTLQLVDLSIWNNDTKYVLLIAAFIGEVRLIDNITL